MPLAPIGALDVTEYRRRLGVEMAAFGFPASMVPGEGAIESSIGRDLLWMNKGQENFVDANRVVLWVTREDGELFVRYAFAPTGTTQTIAGFTFGRGHAGLLRRLCELLAAAGLGDLPISYDRYAVNAPPIVQIADRLATATAERTVKRARTTANKALARMAAAGIATLP